MRKEEVRKGLEMKSNLLLIIFASALTLAACSSSFASSVQLQWDPNNEPDLAGYRVHYMAASPGIAFDGAIATVVDVANQTTAAINDIDPSQTYSFAVTAYNLAGVESSFSNIVNVQESMPPSAAITSPSNTSMVSGTVSVSATASDNVDVSKVEFYLDGVLQYTETTYPYLYSWNTSSLSGSHSLMVKAYDAAGNVGQSSNVNVNVVNDSIAPSVFIASPANGSVVGRTVAMNVTASDNVGVTRVEFYENGVLKAAMNTSPYIYSWNTELLNNGIYTLTAKAYDNAGNFGESSVVTVTVLNDSTPPVVAINSPVAGATVSGTVALSATVTDNVAVSKVEFYVNGILKATSTGNNYGFNWNTSIYSNGSHVLTAMAYDSAGNVGQSTSVNVTVFNDITAPVVAIISPANSVTMKGVVGVSVTATDNVAVSRVEFFVNGNLQASTSAAPYNFSWNSSVVANGSYMLSAKAYDAAGNIGQSASINVSVNNPIADIMAPKITFISPNSTTTYNSYITINVAAIDNVAVTKMELYVDGKLLFSKNTTSIKMRVRVVKGLHEIVAKAYDAAKNGASSSIYVTRLY